MPRSLYYASFVAVCFAACGSPPMIPVDHDGGEVHPDTGAPEPDAGPALPDAGPAASLSIARLVPDHGSFEGGAEVALRGEGFAEGASVQIGGRPAETAFVDARRLAVRVPPGTPGPARVEVLQGGEVAALDPGFTYEALHIDPAEGGTAGGTRLSVRGRGTRFDASTTVAVGTAPCADVEVEDAEHLVCTTPSGEGRVDVAVTTGADVVVAREAFAFVAPEDAAWGGLGGGPIEGEVRVHVRNASCRGEPVEGARVAIEDGPRGTTDAEGQAVVSADGLAGPVTVHVGRDCFASVTLAGVDARSVTVLLEANEDCGIRRACAPDPFASGAFGGPAPASVEGHLRFPGPSEFGRNPWAGIPEPGAGERRVAHVFRTTSRPFGDSLHPSTLPDGLPPAASEGVVAEDGYPYRTIVEHGTFAVFALAGLEHPDGSFTPYLLGVRTGVHALPGDRVQGIDVDMTTPLDARVRVAPLATAALVASGAPDRWSVRARVDLGAAGVIERGRLRGDGAGFGTTAEDALVLDGLPRFDTLPPGARLHLSLVAHSGAAIDAPLTSRSVLATPRFTGAMGELDVPAWLAVPRPEAELGTPWPAQGALRWTYDGPVPSVVLVTVRREETILARAVVRGDLGAVRVPDASLDAAFPALPDGAILVDYDALELERPRIEDVDWRTIWFRHGWVARAETHAWHIHVGGER